MEQMLFVIWATMYLFIGVFCSTILQLGRIISGKSIELSTGSFLFILQFYLVSGVAFFIAPFLY